MLLAITLALAAGPPARAAAGLSTAHVAAALESHPVRRLGGGTLAPPSLAGRVVVLSFWASWCGPCRRELPRLAALETELAKSGGMVVAVSIDADPRNAADFARRHAPGMVVYHDGPDGIARTLDLPALPYTVVLDRFGAVVWSGGGADAGTLAQITETARRLGETRDLTTGSTEGTTR